MGWTSEAFAAVLPGLAGLLHASTEVTNVGFCSLKGVERIKTPKLMLVVETKKLFIVLKLLSADKSWPLVKNVAKALRPGELDHSCLSG